jgi:DNA-binding response OmpR family regulator
MMRKTSILICEDDPTIVKLLKAEFERHDYRVTAVTTKAEAESALDEGMPDLILLDIILETNNAGWELLERIRQKSQVPVILVSALSRADDRVRGLRSGADDFISKPFHLGEVIARAEAVLRRSQPSVPELELTIDDLRKEVCIAGRTIRLSPKEYQLIKLLASKPGRVFTTTEILNELWPATSVMGKKTYADAQDVQKYVYLLRKKIETDPKAPSRILTVRGFGYRLGV